MSWAKLDDRIHDSSEFNGLSDGALALWTRAQSRMGQLLTDGVLTELDLERLDLSRSADDRQRAPWRDLMSELAGRGLFIHDEDAGQWRDRSWLTRNPSREEVEAERHYGAIRTRRSYAKARGDDDTASDLKRQEDAARLARNQARERRMAAADALSPNSVSNGVSDTDPSRPDPQEGRGRKLRRPAASERPTGADDEKGACSQCGRSVPWDNLAVTDLDEWVCQRPECREGQPFALNGSVQVE